MNEIRKCFIIQDRQLKEGQEKDRVIIEAFRFMEMFALCQHTRMLPKPGGLFDQDSYFVHLYKHAMTCQEERRKLDEMRSRTERGR